MMAESKDEHKHMLLTRQHTRCHTGSPQSRMIRIRNDVMRVAIRDAQPP